MDSYRSPHRPGGYPEEIVIKLQGRDCRVKGYADAPFLCTRGRRGIWTLKAAVPQGELEGKGNPCLIYVDSLLAASHPRETGLRKLQESEGF